MGISEKQPKIFQKTLAYMKQKGYLCVIINKQEPLFFLKS